jgi:hypothetical protein
MDPRDFQALASRLASGNTPAEYRSAISRSYYAVFNVRAEALRSLGFSVGKGAAAHGEVQKCLSNAGDPAVSVVASDLGALHSQRNRADYQLDRLDIEDVKTVQAVVAQAGNMIDVLDASFRGPQRSQLHSAIQQWRRDNGYP